ncbi:FAD-binding and (Fe-S)-binding domain-containing protein [Bacteroidota bacterium]
MLNSEKLKNLKELIIGEVYDDKTSKILYSTDASAYKEEPIAVAIPENNEDLLKLINFARENKSSLIPRGAGTSLAGQVVGNGIVVDISKNFTGILEINEKEKWVRVQPGVILDELNIALKENNLFFGPETSTSNRCVIGGMVGNNSCGSHSIIYGSTRDHLLEIKAFLSDGSEVEFKNLSKNEFEEKCKGDKLENKIYQNIKQILSDTNNAKEIRAEYPDSKIKRRNTGYALDLLLETEVFSKSKEAFNFCKLIAGSEGTLAFITEIKLNLVPLPPKEKGLVCAHFKTKEEAFKANLIALKYNPGAVELMDDNILKLTEGNIEQKKNRFFVEGNPAAILIIEFARDSKSEIEDVAKKMENDMRNANYGYHFPIIFDDNITKVWSLRKAGLGLLSNLVGDAKPVSLIEDTTVNVEVLADYLTDFEKILKKYNKNCIYHAHIGSGELHLRPILNLKNKDDVELFHTIGYEVAKLVKKYNGSLSGEHGDGRLRGEFIPLMIGKKNYELLKSVKQVWDPNNIFNPEKIVDTPTMNTFLRYEPGENTKEISTYFNFDKVGGIIRATEKCNGSGDCRKSEIIGGTMCPSYMASRDEIHVTRARANILREFLKNSPKKNPFNHKEIYEILDLCLSCKACKSECPSSVDVAKLKAEFLQHYYDSNGIPLRSRLIAYISSINRLGSVFPRIFNFILSNKFLSSNVKRMIGFAKKRSIPLLSDLTFRRWVKYSIDKLNAGLKNAEEIYLFIDEFTNYNEAEIGVQAVKVLNKLGYKVNYTNHSVSGRTFLSKGFVRKAKKIATKNVQIFSKLINSKIPLLGIEPSAILTFRDEYPELVDKKLEEKAVLLAQNCYMIDEFISKKFEEGKINRSDFSTRELKIKLHGHCQQKAIASTIPTKKMLEIPENYSVIEIKSGCCGMAGSFGYEKEHYNLSMAVGELVLFPEIRNSRNYNVIAAPGTSCRQQIFDGTGKQAFHPIEIIHEALN